MQNCIFWMLKKLIINKAGFPWNFSMDYLISVRSNLTFIKIILTLFILFYLGEKKSCKRENILLGRRVVFRGSPQPGNFKIIQTGKQIFLYFCMDPIRDIEEAKSTFCIFGIIRKKARFSLQIHGYFSQSTSCGIVFMFSLAQRAVDMP